MLELIRQAGVRAALLNFSATKCAGFLSDTLASARQQAFGQPTEALKQLREGTLFKPETGLYYQGLPRTFGQLAGNLVVPLAMTAAMAHLNPAGGRGELVGDMVGRITGSMLGHPVLGTAGGIGGGMLLSNLGGALGRQYDAMRAPSNSDVAVEQ
jgi:hypothetical protein